MGEEKQKSLLINLVRLLSKDGYTLDDIAKELALPCRVLSNYIIGQEKCKEETISDICTIYNVTKDDVDKYKKQRLSLKNKTTK